MLISLLLHVGSFVCLIEKKQNCVLNMLILPAEVLKNRSNMITCMKLPIWQNGRIYDIPVLLQRQVNLGMYYIISSVTYVFN